MSLILLAIWIVKCSFTKAVILLELTLVGLTIGPHVGSEALLLSLVELSKEEARVWPLEEALAVHGIVRERPLVNLTPRCYPAPIPIDLTFFKEAFE